MTVDPQLPDFAWWVGRTRRDFLGMSGPFTAAHEALLVALDYPELLYVAANDEDLTPLFGMPLRVLNLAGRPASDTGVTRMAALESLTLRTVLTSPLRWDGDTERLQTLYVSARRVSDLSQLLLRHLSLVEHTRDDLTAVRLPSTLTALGITGRLRDVAGVEHLANLQSLGTDCPALTRLYALADLPGVNDLRLARLRWEDLNPIPPTTVEALIQLWVIDTGFLRDLSVLARAKALRRLCLLNVKSIQSLNPLRGSASLQRLDLLGTTSVADGDLQVLLSLPSLAWAVSRNRRHYNLRGADLQAWSDPEPVRDLHDTDFPNFLPRQAG